MKYFTFLIITLFYFKGFSQSQTLNSGTVTLCGCPGELWNTSVHNKPIVSFSLAGASKRVMFSNYGFTIPANATIKGIEVEYDYNTNATGNTLQDTSVLLLYWGNMGGFDKSSTTAAYTSSNTIIVGGPTDTWGWFWTPTDINNAGFGFNFKLISSQAGVQFSFLNGAQITVYYELPNGIKEFQKSISSAKITVKDKQVNFVSENDKNSEINIYNILVTKIYSATKTSTESKEINLNNFEKGIYVYSIKSNGKEKTGKFLLD